MRYFFIASWFILAGPTAALAFDANRHIQMTACQPSGAGGVGECIKEQVDECLDAAKVLGEAAAVSRSCGHIAYEQADQMLNNFYQNVLFSTKAIELEKLNNQGIDHAGQETLLRQSQRDWVKVRDSTCELGVSYGSVGSGRDFLVSLCRARLSLQRIDDLQWEIGGFLQ
jgi:uncharacterized protein YecT (DUF1311 family)